MFGFSRDLIKSRSKTFSKWLDKIQVLSFKAFQNRTHKKAPPFPEALFVTDMFAKCYDLNMFFQVMVLIDQWTTIFDLFVSLTFEFLEVDVETVSQIDCFTDVSAFLQPGVHWIQDF